MSISKQEILQIVEIFRHDRWSDWKNIGCLKVQWSWAAKQLENSFETRNDERLALLKAIQDWYDADKTEIDLVAEYERTA